MTSNQHNQNKINTNQVNQHIIMSGLGRPEATPNKPRNLYF